MVGQMEGSWLMVSEWLVDGIENDTEWGEGLNMIELFIIVEFFWLYPIKSSSYIWDPRNGSQLEPFTELLWMMLHS